MRSAQYGEINLKIFKTRTQMGEIAAKEASERIKKILAEKEEMNCIFAAAPSQIDFMESLIKNKDIDWKRINAYHMDEYLGFEIGHSRSFSGFLNNAIFTKVPFKSVNLINGMANPEEESERYAKVLENIDIDIIFMGIGENGHIAFNDPGVADFNDRKAVKVVELEESCRIQQVNDGCFAKIEDVPTKAITLTIPTLTSADYVFCIVPTESKAVAIKETLTGQIDEKCPASILRVTKNVNMYIDEACAKLL